MKAWHVDRLPAPAGHYVYAMQSGHLVHLSGVLPDFSQGDSFDDQFRTCFDRIEAILAQGDLTLTSVVQCTVYIADIALWDRFNQLYRARLGEHRCARTVVPVPNLHFGAQIEVQVVAEVSQPA